MFQRIVLILFVATFLAGCSSSATEREEQKEYDVQRVKDVHHIARLVEDYFQKVGYYPLTNKGYKLPINIRISSQEYGSPQPHVHFRELDKELRKVLGDDINIPFDPDLNNTKSSRLYQYYTDTADYEVSAFLYSQNKFTREITTYSHKYQIGAIPKLKRKKYRLQDIEYINEHGFDNLEDQRALLLAARDNDIDTINKLVEKGVNLSPLCDFNYIGQPLVPAVEAHNIELMKLLISKGADVNGRNGYYDTPLIYAMLDHENINNEVIKILLEAGADVNQPNAYGMSPFIGACASGDLELVKLLHQYGGDVNAQNVSLMENDDYQKNSTPLQYAEKYGHKQVVDFLKKNGATE